MVLQRKVGALPHSRRTLASRVRTGSGQPACVHALGRESSGVVRPPRSFQFERRRTPGNGFLSVVPVSSISLLAGLLRTPRASQAKKINSCLRTL